ncbi:hypothetical protein ACFORG_06235 [Lutimaribacter marinistellae]|uniref:Restriction endonuclease n=1 Tax=Lutimaribacter marinistellae TaxID=1820329 RepID=A0ABV7TCP8_9RHOB
MNQKPLSKRPLKIRAVEALLHAFSRQHPDTAIDAKGYVTDFRDTLLPGVFPEDFEADLSAGDGNELNTKFGAAHSSSGLAVNCFAPFRRQMTDLKIQEHGTFDELQFEQKCSTGLRGGRAPNLDILLSGPNGIVAIESKLTEYLSAHRAKFSPAYGKQIQDTRREQGYFHEMQRLQECPGHYTRLDAAQLIKHAFGLAHNFSNNRPVTLLYLFWEPANPDVSPEFATHRDEIQEFKTRVSGSSPAFEAMSYPELWRFWRENGSTPAWLRQHLDNLQRRYLPHI